MNLYQEELFRPATRVLRSPMIFWSRAACWAGAGWSAGPGWPPWTRGRPPRWGPQSAARWRYRRLSPATQPLDSDADKLTCLRVKPTFDGWNSKRMSFNSRLVFLILNTKLIVLWFSGMFSSLIASCNLQTSYVLMIYWCWMIKTSQRSASLRWMEQRKGQLTCLFLGPFFWIVSSSLSSSSLDQTQSPVSFRCKRPEVPGFLDFVLLTLTSGLGAALTKTPWRYFLSFALFLKNACFNSSEAVGLFEGSFCKHSLIIFLKVFPAKFTKNEVK